MPKYICDNRKYNLAGPGEATIGLPILLDNLPKEIEVEDYKLSLKTEFHVSLVCIGKIMEKHKILRPDFMNKVVNDFCNFTQRKSIDFVHFRDEFRFATKNEKRTVIAMCDVSNLDEFFDVINKKYDLKIEFPPTHVTLYTLQPNLGIFLIDHDDINNLTKVITPPPILKQTFKNQA